MNPTSATTSRKRLALVIDDDELVRATIASILQAVGYDVTEAEGGQGGLQAFQRQPVELVITDIIMPSKEGIETILELRERSRDVRIIAMTGGGSIGTGPILRAAKGLGADAVLSKPFSRTELLKAMRAFRSLKTQN